MMADGVGNPSRSAMRHAQYRVRQFRQAVQVSLHPLGPADAAEARSVLPDAAWELYSSLPQVDRRHGLAVLRMLRAGGYEDPALAQAALLHDCAKHCGGVTLGHRILFVLIKTVRPSSIADLAAAPEPGPGGWKQGFWAHAHHPETGAMLAEAAGCDPLAVSLIRRHQEPPALSGDDRFLAALQAADDDN